NRGPPPCAGSPSSFRPASLLNVGASAAPEHDPLSAIIDAIGRSRHGSKRTGRLDPVGARHLARARIDMGLGRDQQVVLGMDRDAPAEIDGALALVIEA